ncbi:amidohydrolase [Rhodoligotrophos ferricapiens]|uniref:amidohydrolase n=1 Tax=Rhodoligotrophos ferricapiens TaxID=3069264 RepID=UPI00315CA093
MAMHPAELIIRNAKIATMSDAQPFVQAVAVRDGRILAVGRDDEIGPWRGPQTEIIDAQGKTVLPGFIESHCHADIYGARIHRWADFSWPNVRSKEEVLARIVEATATLPKEAWFVGFRYDDMKLGGFPTIDELDRAGNGHPVFIYRTDHHNGVVNTAAFERSGLAKLSEDPPFGRIDRDPATGKPTGLVRENAAYVVVDELSKDYTAEDFRKGLRQVFAEFLSYGITSLHNSLTQSNGIRAYQDMRAAGELPIRIGIMVSGKEAGLVESYIRAGIRSGFGDEWIRILGVEWCPDCSTTGRTAAYYEPYIGPKALGEPEHNTGMLLYSSEDFRQKVMEATAAGLAVFADGVGDRGIDYVLDAFEAALAVHPNADSRMRVEHSCCATPEIRERMKKLNVIPSSAAGFLYDLGDGYIRVRGEAAMKNMWPHRSWKEMGVIAPAHSDAPICHPNPLRGVYSLVTRKTDTGQLLGKEEAVDLWEALKSYTIYGAYAGREEAIKGSIEPGKLADFVILEEDIFTVDPERIPHIKVNRTIVHGQTAFSA